MKPNWRKLSRRTAITLVVAGVLLLGLRLALPFAVKRYVNQVLNRIPDYRGHVEDINIKLWRGAYVIHGMKLEKLRGSVPVPFFEAEKVDLMIEWRELFHGALTGQITFYRPKLNYVAGPTAEASQTAIDKSWQERVKELFPLRLNRVQVVDGEIHFRNFHSQPKVNVFLDEVQVVATNLKNTRVKGESLFATVEISGKPMKEATLLVRARLNPLARAPTFDLNGELINLPVTELNQFFMAYSGFELTGGHADIFTEVAAKDGVVTGYIKPLIKDTGIKVWSGHESNPTLYVWEPLVAFLSLLMKNWPEDQFAAKIPISGKLEDPQFHSGAAFLSLLENAWIERLKPGVEGTVNLRSARVAAAEEKAKKAQPPTDAASVP